MSADRILITVADDSGRVVASTVLRQADAKFPCKIKLLNILASDQGGECPKFLPGMK